MPRPSDQVQYNSFEGKRLHGVLLSVEDPIEATSPNRTDIANGIAPEDARVFTSRQQFGDILVMGEQGNLFKARKNLNWVYPDPNRAPIVGLDYDANGERLTIGKLIDLAMDAQAAALGASDGLTVTAEAATK